MEQNNPKISKLEKVTLSVNAGIVAIGALIGGVASVQNKSPEYFLAGIYSGLMVTTLISGFIYVGREQ